jgi:hypothetical protein
MFQTLLHNVALCIIKTNVNNYESENCLNKTIYDDGIMVT